MNAHSELKMINRQKNRYNIFIRHKSILEKLREPRDKDTTAKRNFYIYLYNAAKTVFESELDEYNYIGTFGSGLWDMEKLARIFNADEMSVVAEIAYHYGAFGKDHIIISET